MIKKVIFFILVVGLVGFFSLTIFNQQVWASSDLKLACNNKQCIIKPLDTPMFSEANVKPSDIFTQVLTLKNKGGDISDFYLKITKNNPEDFPTDFAKHFFFAIKKHRNQKEVLAFTPLADLVEAEKTIYLGSVMPGRRRKLDFIMQFDPQAGNELQAQNILFDLNMSFVVENKGRLPESETENFSFVRLDSTNSTGQVLGASTTAQLRLRLKAKYRHNPMLKRWLPVVVAGLTVVSLLGLMVFGWWLIVAFSKKVKR